MLLGSFCLAIAMLSSTARAELTLAEASKLKPGTWIWKPELSPAGPVAVIVSLSDQLAYVYRNGIRIGVTTISSGRKGFATPTGVFSVQRKERMHHSSKYHNAPMPDSQFFFRGAALHAGGLPGYPSSHGCVHLPRKFADRLFQVTHNGTPVVITKQHFGVGSLEHAGFLMTDSDLQQIEKLTGNVRSKTLPFDKKGDSKTAYSIVVSSAERKVAVFKDGAVVYEAPIGMRDGAKFGEHIFQLVGTNPANKLNWVAVGGDQRPGFNPDAYAATAVAARMSLSPEAQNTIASILHPGSTVVFTDFAAGAQTRTGSDFVVMNVDLPSRP